MDDDRLGFISLSELAPTEHALLTLFSNGLAKLAPTTERVWPLLDRNRTGKVRAAESGTLRSRLYECFRYCVGSLRDWKCECQGSG